MLQFPHIRSSIVAAGAETSTARGVEVARSGGELKLSIVVIDVRSVVNSVIVVGEESNSDVPVVAGTEVGILNSCDVVVPLVVGWVDADFDTSYFVDN